MASIDSVHKSAASGLVEQMASLESRLKNLPISKIPPDSVPMTDLQAVEEAADSSSPASPDSGDPALRALMFGRYTGQISARIERAWIRPRSPVMESAPENAAPASAPPVDQEFRCRVEIRQDERGNVQEVLLVECNGTEAWRHSLVVAINQASPLPAPPIPNLFRRAVTMSFDAPSYQPGSPPDAYEQEPPGPAPQLVAIMGTRPLRLLTLY